MRVEPITPSRDDLYWHVGGVKEVWCSVVKPNETNVAAENLVFFKNSEVLPHQYSYPSSSLSRTNKEEGPREEMERDKCLETNIRLSLHYIYRISQGTVPGCRLVEARHQDVTSFPECGCLLTDTHTPHAPQMVNSTTIGVTLNLTEPDEFKLICTDRNGNTCMAQVKIGCKCCSPCSPHVFICVVL
ncbi:hypothetical protein E2C01_003380 [Portunus trituberculatus]|uniref:Uncharacterized protein n=1 Tax=Portunus trituberculatus TaxID=210409 RepID=A0A5B7CMN6_PORTR|nr:hypothetical protein [Portunus trituberculatus]